MSPVMPSHSSGSQQSDALSQAEQLFASPQREGDVSGLSVDVSALSADETREGGVEFGSCTRWGHDHEHDSERGAAGACLRPRPRWARFPAADRCLPAGVGINRLLGT